MLQEITLEAVESQRDTAIELLDRLDALRDQAAGSGP